MKETCRAENMEKLSIYITTYNRIEYLKIAVRSVFDQTSTDFKLYILDNCSTDGTEDYVLSINDPKVHYIKHPYNIGGIENINYAFEHCDSDYFCVFHDDDIFHSALLETEVLYMDQHVECAAVSCLSNYIDESGRIIKSNSDIDNDAVKEYSNTDFFENYINKQHNLIFPATMYRNQFVKEHRIRLKKSTGPCADVVLYMDIEKAGGVIAEIQKPLYSYRVYAEQDSSINFEKMLMQLIKYLNQDTYYSTLLNNNKKGKERYYRWYIRKLLIRVASQKINHRIAKQYFEEMRKELDGAFFYYYIVKMILCLEDIFPIPFKCAYRWAKERPDR